MSMKPSLYHRFPAYRQFRKSPCDVSAMAALAQIAYDGEQIPDDLLPYIPIACEAWMQTKGNKGRVRVKETEHLKKSAIGWVAWLNRNAGKTIAEAADAVHEIYPRYSAETLIDEHKRAAAKSDREPSLNDLIQALPPGKHFSFRVK